MHLAPPRTEQHLARNVPEGFRLSSSGVFLTAQLQSAKPQEANKQEEDVWICSPLFVNAHTRNHQNEDWAKLLEFLDTDGNRHRCFMPMSALAGHGAECCAQLLSQGLQIAPGRKAREAVIAYISSADPDERVRCTNELGWHDDAYVLPEESIQPVGSEPVFYQTTIKTKPSLSVSGSLEDWQEAIGCLCPDNSRLVFAVSCAFAPPLLRLVNEPGGGFNLYGASSTGKTTALLVAASVRGGEGTVKTWRMTANGLDTVAQNHNDGLLCLDELGQANGKEVGEVVYALANGTPKRRQTQNIATTWTLLILSSGETSLAEHMGAAGKRVRSGQEVRLCDLEADAGAGLGVFENLHGFENASAFARHLTESARHCYGTPIRAFLKTLVEEKERAAQSAVALRDQFLERYVPAGASGEVRRAASRFALVAAAGELAAQAGVTGWREGEALHAAGVCFGSWLNGRPTTAATAENAIRRVRHFLETQPALGKQSGSPAYPVPPEIFRRDLCAGFDPKMVLQILKEQGYLEHDPGRFEKSVRLPGAGTRRVYSIKARILDQPSTAPIYGGVNSGDGGNTGDASSKLPQAGDSRGDGSVATRSGDSGDIPAATVMVEDAAAERIGASETLELPIGVEVPIELAARGATADPAANRVEA